MQLLMQKAYDDPVQAFIDVSPLLQAVLKQKQGTALFNEMFHYILTGDGQGSASKVILRLEEGLQGKAKGAVMTLAQLLKREGEQVGLQKGMEKAATRMLQRGMQAQEVIAITRLSKQRIVELLASIKQKITKGG